MAEETGARVTMNEAVRRHVTQPAYDYLRTRIGGAMLRYEKGIEPDMNPSEVSGFVRTAATWVRKKRKIEEALKKQKEPEDALKATAGRYGGPLAAILEKDNAVVRLFKRINIDWDFPKLYEKLGASSSLVIHESIRVTLNLPTMDPEGNTMTEERARKLAFLGFTAVGYEPDDADNLVKSEIVRKVDEEALYPMVQDGLDIESTGVATETWVLQADSIDK